MKFTFCALLALSALFASSAASAADNAGQPQKSGQEVYSSVCMACHDSGVLNAPRIGNKQDWAPRIAQGYNTLVKHALEGFNVMPAKGGAANLSDQEVAEAVVYMVNKSGGKFKAPD